MLFKPSYIVNENKLTAYRSRYIAISFTLGGLLGCLTILIMPLIRETWEVNVYTIIFYLLMLIIILYCFKYLFDYEVKFEISAEGVFIQNRYIKWKDISRFEWNYTGGQQGLHYLNFYITENNDLTKPIEYRYEIDIILKSKFKKKIFDPFVCRILKNHPHIRTSEDYCLCKDHWEYDNATS